MEFALAVYYMNPSGQAPTRESGYAMAALLVAIAVMGIVMSVAMPAWRQANQREKEEELIFRGRQYMRAIQLYQRKFAATYPPDVDLLVKQKFLRKKYKDPMVEDGEFEVVYQGTQLAVGPGRGGPSQGQGQRGGATGQAPSSFTFDSRSGAITQGGPGGRSVGPRGGVLGVRSKNTDESIRVYNGATHYNEWQFVFVPSMPTPGQARPGMPGGRGGPGMPGQQGMPGGGRGGPGGMGGQGGGGFPSGPRGGRGPGG
jgi:type II secretory pathway pseudopilin PulG